jgi:hypothetical protein
MVAVLVSEVPQAARRDMLRCVTTIETAYELFDLLETVHPCIRAKDAP